MQRRELVDAVAVVCYPGAGVVADKASMNPRPSANCSIRSVFFVAPRYHGCTYRLRMDDMCGRWSSRCASSCSAADAPSRFGKGSLQE